jgi:hypothetical protein
MKKLLTLAAAAVMAVSVAGQAAAAKPFKHVTGSVTLANPTQTLSFSAFDYGTSRDRGTVTYTNPGAGVSYTANVLCAWVNPGTDTAVFAYQIPAGEGALSGLYIVWKVTDGGSPGEDNDTAGFAVVANQGAAIAACTSGTVATTNYVVTDGNIVVH